MNLIVRRQIIKRQWRSACHEPGDRRTRRGVNCLTLGLRHGLYCIGCCWALMALLFVPSVMNLFWIAALAILVLLEKVIPSGRASMAGAVGHCGL